MTPWLTLQFSDEKSCRSITNSALGIGLSDGWFLTSMFLTDTQPQNDRYCWLVMRNSKPKTTSWTDNDIKSSFHCVWHLRILSPTEIKQSWPRRIWLKTNWSLCRLVSRGPMYAKDIREKRISLGERGYGNNKPRVSLNIQMENERPQKILCTFFLFISPPLIFNCNRMFDYH